jgi:hypothetical protein
VWQTVSSGSRAASWEQWQRCGRLWAVAAVRETEFSDKSGADFEEGQAAQCVCSKVAVLWVRGSVAVLWVRGSVVVLCVGSSVAVLCVRSSGAVLHVGSSVAVLWVGGRETVMCV